MTRLLPLAVLSCAVSWCAAGPGVDDDLGERLAAVVDRAHLGQFWGAVVVRVGGEDVLRRGYGFEGPWLTPIDPGASLFDVGSVSKSLTAAAALRLVEEGTLSLDATLAEIFPAAEHDAGAFAGVRVRDLLGHRLGVESRAITAIPADLDDPTGWLGVLREVPVTERDGRFAYSNVAYFLAAAVIQEASGEPFEEAVRSRVIKAAGLRATGFVGDGSVEGGRATARVSWRSYGGATTLFEYPWNWGQRGATGVVMTADDAARWVEAAWGGGVLQDASRAAMFDPGDAGYGMGWFVTEDEDGVWRVGHGGTTGGYACAVAHYPRAAEGRGVTVVVMTNDPMAAPRLEQRLAAVAAPEPARPSRAGVYLLRYPLEAGVAEVSGGLGWEVHSSYSGQGADGRRFVDDRPTVVLTDARRGMWAVMVAMDPADAAALLGSVDAAASEAAGTVAQAGAAPTNAELTSLRIDAAGRAISDLPHIELLGAAWVPAAEDAWVVARLVAADGGVVATVRMDPTTARALAGELRAALQP